MTYFDIPPGISRLLAVATKHNLIVDHNDLVALGATHGDRWAGYVDEILERLEACRHTGEMDRDARIEVADACNRLELRKDFSDT